MASLFWFGLVLIANTDQYRKAKEQSAPFDYASTDMMRLAYGLMAMALNLPPKAFGEQT